MFGAIYRFEVKPGMREQFIKNWSFVTDYLYAKCGSLGSRLHLVSEDGAEGSSGSVYVAYAQWPTRAAWEAASADGNEEARNSRQLMRESCGKIETLYAAEVVVDLLRQEPSSHG